MIKTVFWVGVGFGLGVFVTTRVVRARQQVRAEGLGRAVGMANERVSAFGAAVRANMSERENELRAALGVSPEPHGQAFSAREVSPHPLPRR